MSETQEATQTAVTAQTQTADNLPAQRAPRAPLIGGNAVMAIVPKDIEQVFRLAGAIASADMAPKSYNRSVEKITVGIMHGLEVGLTPMAALQSIAVINGMPTIWGDGALALIQASGLLEDMEETLTTDKEGGLIAFCRMKRKGRATEVKQTFSWNDAIVAKLAHKDTYKAYPQRMLKMRARAWCMRDGFADILRGLGIREEVADMGHLQEQEDGSYGAQAQTVIPPKPKRKTEKEVEEEARKAASAMDGQYRNTMAARKNAPAQEAHDAETGEVHEDPKPEETAKDDDSEWAEPEKATAKETPKEQAKKAEPAKAEPPKEIRMFNATGTMTDKVYDKWSAWLSDIERRLSNSAGPEEAMAVWDFNAEMYGFGRIANEGNKKALERFDAVEALGRRKRQVD